MSILNNFASGLVDEVLGEMAENFFGSRKRLDERIEQFASLANNLRKIQEDTVHIGGGLLALLPGEGADAVRRAFAGEGIVLPRIHECALPKLDRRPFGLTLGARYAKVVLAQYAAYQAAVEGYMHGEHSPHPDQPKRLVVSLHYTQLVRFAAHVNEAIEKINQEMPASCVVRYASGFADPGLADRERIAGAHCPYPGQNEESDFDKHYAYQTIDFSAYGLQAFAALPPPEEAAPVLRRICSKLMKEEKAAIVKIMAALYDQ